MSEYADMVMNGLICGSCHSVIEDMEEPGYPRICLECQAELDKELSEEKD